MISNITLIKLFEEMMVSEKISSANTRRAYVSDIKTFIGFLKSENEMSVLSIEKKHLTAWLSKLNDDNISRLSNKFAIGSPLTKKIYLSGSIGTDRILM